VRRLAWLFALLFVACSPASGPAGPPGSGNSAASSPAPGGTNNTSTKPGASSASSVYKDFGALGTMARNYLRASPARRLVVEVAWVAGLEPNQGALDHLSQVLGDVTDKPGGVSVLRGRSFASSKSSYSVADIRAVESQNRGRFSGGDTVTMWIVYLNGSFADQEGALGLAYGATSAAVFRDRLNDAATALILEPAIERAVVTHEVGHLLALINIGYHSARDHEDPEHRSHSRSNKSVMYWAVEDLSLKNLVGGPPDDFDADDRADLEMLKSA
jgi:hypothetical protein